MKKLFFLFAFMGMFAFVGTAQKKACCAKASSEKTSMTSADAADVEKAATADASIVKLVREHFDLRPKGIVDMLNLKRPIYRKTAAYGHFGREDEDFTWELTDKADVLRGAM